MRWTWKRSMEVRGLCLIDQLGIPKLVSAPKAQAWISLTTLYPRKSKSNESIYYLSYLLMQCMKCRVQECMTRALHYRIKFQYSGFSTVMVYWSVKSSVNRCPKLPRPHIIGSPIGLRYLLPIYMITQFPNLQK